MERGETVRRAQIGLAQPAQERADDLRALLDGGRLFAYRIGANLDAQDPEELVRPDPRVT
jgi:hypothetical protein